MARWLFGFVGVVCLAGVAGCDAFRETPVDAPQDDVAPVSLGEHFDAGRCGTVTGTVTWPGAMPAYAAISVAVPRSGGGVVYKHYPNPNTPQIDRATRAVRGTVIFLERVEPARSRPWDHAAVRVELHDDQIRIVQGDSVGPIGFVRCGEEIEMVSRQPAFHALTARGAAFFALTFADPDQPLRRRLTDTGVVELTSGAGKYWHQAYLFVAEHPYYVLTDVGGRFTLNTVPPGEYRVLCWLPNGHVTRTDRDPNMGTILRQTYAAPFQQVQKVNVVPGTDTRIEFTIGND